MINFESDIAIKVLFTIALALGTQFFKERKPEVFLQYKNWVTIILIAIAAIINTIQYFALNQPIFVSSIFALVIIVFNQLIAGAAMGASSTGLYEVLKPTASPFRSVNEVLVAKSDKTGVIEITKTFTAEPTSADVMLEQTEVTYDDKAKEVAVEVKSVEPANSIEKKYNKTRKQSK